jgi:hypothetical protein
VRNTSGEEYPTQEIRRRIYGQMHHLSDISCVCPATHIAGDIHFATRMSVQMGVQANRPKEYPRACRPRD